MTVCTTQVEKRGDPVWGLGWVSVRVSLGMKGQHYNMYTLVTIPTHIIYARYNLSLFRQVHPP